MTSDEAFEQLSEKINTLLVTVYQSGMLNSVQQVTELLEKDEKAGVPVSMQRVIAHLRSVAAAAETAVPPEVLT